MGFSDFNPRPDFDTSAFPNRAISQDHPFDPSDDWLGKGATQKQRLIALRAWFRARFWDPANDTPYEGGYIWVNGGPYSPEEELADRFSGVVDQSLIDQVAKEMMEEVGDEWARIHTAFEDDYDDRFDIDALSEETPLDRLNTRMAKAMGVLALQGGEEEKTLLRQLVFGTAITALESFLWETMAFWVERDDQVRRELFTRLPALKDQPLKLGTIFERHEGLKEELKGYLQNLVWHRWDRVAPLFAIGLAIKAPNFQQFDAALIKRHDIVHRSGHDKAGTAISVSDEEIKELSSQILAFASQIHTELESRKRVDF
jgi:hypothetical protein